ncbi:oxysterol binding family protein [Pelomyxa schiedti]|nr:oxysterol binding family protein [Pelomyxa schiedti]
MNLLQSVISTFSSWTPGAKHAPATTTATTTTTTSATTPPPAASSPANEINESELKVEEIATTNNANNAAENATQVVATPACVVDDATRRTWLKLLYGKIGMDLSVGISLPVHYCEPTTTLSHMAEPYEYAELLNQAAHKATPIERLAIVAVWVISGFSNTERYAKPFNPLLGETYEYIDQKRNFRLVSEQTSHHPPVSASYTEGAEGWVAWQQIHPTTKFLGNSIDVNVNGRSHVVITATGDHFTYTGPFSRLHNLILGRMWLDHWGDFDVVNLRTGDKCTIKFSRCGWMGKNRYEVHALCYSGKGLCCARVTGKWNEKATAQWVSEAIRAQYMESLNLPQVHPAMSAPTADGALSASLTICAWAVEPNRFSGRYKMSEFAKSLITIENEEAICSTDSRLRPDRRALDLDDYENASVFKSTLEERQRADRQTHAHIKDWKWTPKWFRLVPASGDPTAPLGNDYAIEYMGQYWAAKAEANGQHKVFCLPDMNELACNFRIYGYHPQPPETDTENS